eukprot:TRINITY_DN21284_c0_g1_i2.p1 TRINITY_DN21284_c0_g1~~TRINITY_DN21284_c0_g1_i2.p1  ORF type:complete len:399 (-),score=40.59 TRINITY_DN21284_c0_g1_i2:727-1923(-)
MPRHSNTLVAILFLGVICLISVFRGLATLTQRVPVPQSCHDTSLQQRVQELEAELAAIRAEKKAAKLSELEIIPVALKVPVVPDNCPHHWCSGHGRCTTNRGIHRCECSVGWGSRDCTIHYGANGINLSNMLTILHDSAGSKTEFDTSTLLSSLQHYYPDVSVIVSSSVHHAHPKLRAIEGGASQGARLNAMLAEVRTEFFAVLHDTPFVYEQTDLTHLVEMLLKHPLDLVGGIGVDVGKAHASATAVPANAELNVPCYRLVHHRWQLRHERFEFGYERHEGRCMVCDRVGGSYIASTRRVRQALNNFDAEVGDLVHLDLFLRALHWNRAFVPGRVPFVSGVCPEAIFPNKSQGAPERFNSAFKQKQQVEVMTYQNGSESEVMHMKYCHECGCVDLWQ